MIMFLESALVFFLGLPRAFLCMDGQVVHIDGKPSLCYLFAEYSVHHHLKGCWGVGEPKEHDRWFKESLRSKECRFRFVTWFDAYVVVSPSNVEFHEEGTPAQAVDCL